MHLTPVLQWLLVAQENREPVVRQPKAVDALQLEPRAKHKSKLQCCIVLLAEQNVYRSAADGAITTCRSAQRALPFLQFT